MNAENSPKSAAVKPLANRTFGLIFAAIFTLIALLPILFGGDLRQWAALLAVAFFIAALLFPKMLAPLNSLWAKFGLLMHKIVNPILMGLIFFVAVLPTGIIMRLLGKDSMQRKFNADATSYWIDRESGSLSKDSYDNQF